MMSCLSLTYVNCFLVTKRSILLSVSLIVVVLTTSCDDNDEPIGNVDGTYTGVFIRVAAGTESFSSDVVLILDNGSFQGSSSQQRYPAICKGSYFSSGNTLTFEDSCHWTADFDWTLVLSGDYAISRTHDGLILTRTYANGVVDRYILHRSVSQ